jgi:hypothetical protein
MYADFACARYTRTQGRLWTMVAKDKAKSAAFYAEQTMACNVLKASN